MRPTSQLKTHLQLFLEHFPIIRNQPTPPPGHPIRGYPMGGREGVWAGADFVWSKNALVFAETPGFEQLLGKRSALLGQLQIVAVLANQVGG